MESEPCEDLQVFCFFFFNVIGQLLKFLLTCRLRTCWKEKHSSSRCLMKNSCWWLLGCPCPTSRYLSWMLGSGSQLQLSVGRDPRRHEVLAQVCGSVQPTWESWIEAPSFSSIQAPVVNKHWENEPACIWGLSPSVSKTRTQNYISKRNKWDTED